MTTVQSHLANAYEVAINNTVGPSDTVFPVASSAGSPSVPTWMVIEPDVENQREYVYFTSKNATQFVAGQRYGDGSAAGSGLTHPSGSIIRSSPMKQHFEELWDRIGEVSHSENHAGRHALGGADSISSHYVPKGGGEFTGAITVSAGGMTVSGLVTLNNNLSVGGNATVTGNLGVTGTTTFTGAPSYSSNPGGDNVLTRRAYVDAADTSIQGNLTTHNNNNAAHNATDAATASRIMARDASARAKVAAPSAATDIANKQYVDDNASTVRIAEVSGNGSGNTLSFSSIPQTFTHLMVVGRLAQSGPSNLDSCSGRFNNDSSGSNVSYIRRRQQGTVNTLSAGAFTAYFFLVGNAGTLKLWIPHYTSGSSILPFDFASSTQFGLNTDNFVQDLVTGRHEIGASTLTSLQFILDSGAWQTTSRLTLYGIK